MKSPLRWLVLGILSSALLLIVPDFGVMSASLCVNAMVDDRQVLPALCRSNVIDVLVPVSIIQALTYRITPAAQGMPIGNDLVVGGVVVESNPKLTGISTRWSILS